MDVAGVVAVGGSARASAAVAKAEVLLVVEDHPLRQEGLQRRPPPAAPHCGLSQLVALQMMRSMHRAAQAWWFSVTRDHVRALVTSRVPWLIGGLPSHTASLGTQ